METSSPGDFQAVSPALARGLDFRKYCPRNWGSAITHHILSFLGLTQEHLGSMINQRCECPFAWVRITKASESSFMRHCKDNALTYSAVINEVRILLDIMISW